jgi:hypothetical protein
VFCFALRLLLSFLSYSDLFYWGADKSLTRPTSISIVFFQSREQVVVRRGQIRRIGWMLKTLEAQVGQFLLGCKCPVSRLLPGRAKDLSAPHVHIHCRKRAIVAPDHNDTHSQSVGLLWTRDQPHAETSIWQLTTATKKDIHSRPRRDSNPPSQQASGRRHPP